MTSAVTSASSLKSKKSDKKKYTSLEPYFREFFYWYGGFAYKHRWILFIVPILITPLLGTGFLWFNELRVDDPAYVFTPKDARWKRELSTFTKLWPLEENKFQPGKSFEPRRFVNILCKAKDGGNILRPEILSEIQILNNFIMYNISVPTYDGNFNLTYQDLCLSYDWVCGGNEHITMFKEMKQVGRVIDLTFPKGGNKDTPVYLGTVLGDILLNNSNHHVSEARITQLFYFLKQEPDTVCQYSTDFEYAVETFILHAFESDLITLSFAHYQSLQDGLDENAKRFIPNFVISFTSLSIYCIICAFILKKHSNSCFSIDWIRSKPYVACAGLLNTLLTLISAFGLMLIIGVPYNVINTIIPFLIIAIGIDDMFIMCACYDQVDKFLPNRVRMAEMMSNAGVAVSITNVTDILSFLIGCMTDLPGVELFCIYAFVCVLFCYIYQLTFFLGLMALMSVAEEEERHCLFLYKMNKTLKKKALDLSDISNDSSTTNFKSKIHEIECKNLALPLPSFSEINDSNTNLRRNCLLANLNNNKLKGNNVIDNNDKTFEHFYNENLEFLDRQPHLYQYCNLGTIDRQNVKKQIFTQNILIDDDGDSNSYSSSSSIVMSSGEASTATIRTMDEPVSPVKLWSSDKSESSSTNLQKNFALPSTLNLNLSEHYEEKRTTEPNKQPKSTKLSGIKLNDLPNCVSNKTENFSKSVYCVEPYKNSFEKAQNVGLGCQEFKPSFRRDLSERHLHTVSNNQTHLFFNKYYGPILLSNGMRAFVVIIYTIYLVLAMFGCSQFHEGLEPSHLVTADHYIAKYFNDVKMFWKMGAQLHVAVLKPPNLTDFAERDKLMNLVSSLENTDYTMGREGTVFFLLEYINYLNQLNAELENTDRIWHQKLRSWLKYTGGSEQWERDIVYNKENADFQAFRFQIALKNIVEPNQHKLAAKMLREIADSQPFNVEIYHEAFPFADQYLIILPSTYRNVLISLCVMTVIAFLLIPSIPSAMLIVLSIVSISTGVFGYMTFWGVNLDAISMISIIMSIGFAVDLSAHIVYAFVTAHGDTKERVIGALVHLGWPIFQGATSTIAGITVLYTVDAYIILTFFKTIWLTMIIGLIHGLIFLPVMLSFIPISFFRIST